jgi:hypothetical protein
MPVRVVLNTIYALMVKHLDADERRKFDADLYDFQQINQKAERALWGMTLSGGSEPDSATVSAIGVSGVDD